VFGEEVAGLDEDRLPRVGLFGVGHSGRIYSAPGTGPPTW
jgi:hypothetical protein